jgi:hypothetical protein
MKMKSNIIKPLAKVMSKLNFSSQTNAVNIQKNTLISLIKKAKNTQFGKDHCFENITDYKLFAAQVPVRDYEKLKVYIDKIVAGESNICWKGKPNYFAKTSGTTSGAKFIPITKESINHHIVAARNALFDYVAETGKNDFFDRKMIFLQGSPVLTDTNGVKTGRLSGLVYHHVPKWLVGNRKPTYETNCIADWEQKVAAIVEETYQEDMSLISGIPPWCIMYFEKLLEKTGKKTIQEIFPNFKLFIYGGLNYEPYREKIEKLIGFNIDTIETFPASEGFFAYQNEQDDKGLLLNINAGIFYEFIKVEEFHTENRKRICLEEVELDVNYVLIISTNAGLWAYNTGDTVKFTSLNPYKIIVSGRIKHFISAFGEHVIAEEVEFAIGKMAKDFNLQIEEFTVAPFIAKNKTDSSYHEWFVELANEEIDDSKIAKNIDDTLQAKNAYYKDLREGNLLSLPKISVVKKGGFKEYQLSKGKLGGQNKVVHLSNDRVVADELFRYIVNK